MRRMIAAGSALFLVIGACAIPSDGDGAPPIVKETDGVQPGSAGTTAVTTGATAAGAFPTTVGPVSWVDFQVLGRCTEDTEENIARVEFQGLGGFFDRAVDWVLLEPGAEAAGTSEVDIDQLGESLRRQVEHAKRPWIVAQFGSTGGLRGTASPAELVVRVHMYNQIIDELAGVLTL